MKHLYDLCDDSKECFFSQSIYDILDEIQQRCNKWFTESFIECPEYEQFETPNTIADLNFLFTKAIWISEMATQQGYKPTALQFLETNYNDYIKHGHRYFVTDPRFNNKENRINSESEIVANKRRVDELGKQAVEELLKEIENEK